MRVAAPSGAYQRLLARTLLLPPGATHQAAAARAALAIRVGTAGLVVTVCLCFGIFSTHANAYDVCTERPEIAPCPRDANGGTVEHKCRCLRRALPFISHVAMYYPERYAFVPGALVASTILLPAMLYVSELIRSVSTGCCRRAARVVGFCLAPLAVAVVASLQALVIVSIKIDAHGHWLATSSFFTLFAIWGVVATILCHLVIPRKDDGAAGAAFFGIGSWVHPRHLAKIAFPIVVVGLQFVFVLVRRRDWRFAGRYWAPVNQWLVVACYLAFILLFARDLDAEAAAPAQDGVASTTLRESRELDALELELKPVEATMA